MYAIIQTGGKQYRVKPGDIVEVEKKETIEGGGISFDQVMAITDNENIEIGAPFIDGARVNAELVEHKKGKKLIVFKMKRRKRYRRKTGHRQVYLRAKILEIQNARPSAQTVTTDGVDQESDD